MWKCTGQIKWIPYLGPRNAVPIRITAGSKHKIQHYALIPFKGFSPLHFVSTQVLQQDYLEVESALNQGAPDPHTDAAVARQEDDGSYSLALCKTTFAIPV